MVTDNNVHEFVELATASLSVAQHYPPANIATRNVCSRHAGM